MNQPDFDETKLNDFMDEIENLRNKGSWTKMILSYILESCLSLTIKILASI